MSPEVRRRAPRRHLDVCAILVSPALMAALAAGMLVTVAVDRALVAVGDAGQIHRDAEVLAARVVADGAAARFVASSGAAATGAFDAGNGIEVTTAIEPLDADGQWLLTALVGDQRLDWTFATLPGGTSPVFGRALSIVAGAPLPSHWRGAVATEPEDLPRLAPCIDDTRLPSWLQPDPGVALLRLPAGTDRDDFVFAAARADGARSIQVGGVVVVDGNLWVDCGDSPLVLDLDRDLTLIVRGNVYLGRSVRVRGPGHLTLVTVVDGGSAYFDVDGNCRWSPGDRLVGGEPFAGPVEGAGNVLMGALGATVGAGAGPELELDLGLDVGGVLHAVAATVTVHGPVVLRSGAMSRPSDAGRLIATGSRLPAVQRVVLPGFVAVGLPRPGPLRPLAREPLYQSAAPR
ncbi:MAG: hypothetical protein AB7O97_06700 [Planctomycetota bacterium]